MSHVSSDVEGNVTLPLRLTSPVRYWYLGHRTPKLMLTCNPFLSQHSLHVVDRNLCASFSGCVTCFASQVFCPLANMSIPYRFPDEISFPFPRTRESFSNIRLETNDQMAFAFLSPPTTHSLCRYLAAHAFPPIENNILRSKPQITVCTPN